MTATTAAFVRKPMSSLQQALLSFFWLATNIHWTTILVVTMPSQIRDAVGNDTKGTYLGLALAIGAIVSMVAAPAFGALSDRIKLPGGRRKPWVVIGTLGNILGLFGLAYFIRPGDANSLLPWTIAFLWVELFNNVATAPYSALIPDLVPPEQRGSASGWLGLMIVLGNLFGAVLGFLINNLGGVVGIYYVLMLVMLIGAVVTWFGVKEPTGTYEIKTFHWKAFWRGLYDPFKSSDFTWVFMTRLLVTMGIFTVQEFLQYYLGDVIGAPFAIAGIGQVADSPEQAVSLFLGPMLVGGVISTLAAGVISDKSGRKFIVYISGALMGFVALMFVFFHNFTLAVVMGIVFGLGYGAYESVDWAMASDVLPSMDDYAKDMGVWHVAMVLPQVVATPIAGFLLDNFQVVGRTNNIPNLGYTVIFLLSVVYFVLGTVFVKQIKKVR